MDNNNAFGFADATQTATPFNASFNVAGPMVLYVGVEVEVIEAELIDPEATLVVADGEVIDAEIIEVTTYQREVDMWGEVDGLWGLHCDPHAKWAEDAVMDFECKLEALNELGMSSAHAVYEPHPIIAEVEKEIEVKVTKKRNRGIRQRAFAWMSALSMAINLLPIGAALVDARFDEAINNYVNSNQTCQINNDYTNSQLNRLIDAYAEYEEGLALDQYVPLRELMRKYGIEHLGREYSVWHETEEYHVNEKLVTEMLGSYCNRAPRDIDDLEIIEHQVEAIKDILRKEEEASNRF